MRRQKEVFNKKMRKYYKSTPQGQSKTAYFAIEYLIERLDELHWKPLTVHAYISYLSIMDGDKKEQPISSKTSHWELSVSQDRCSLNDSVQITEGFQSLKIGTFLLHTLMRMAIEAYPTVPMRLKLGPGDAQDPVNKARRNRMYEEIGFVISEDGTSTSIDQIGKLKLKDVTCIEEIEIDREFNKLTSRVNDLAAQIEYKDNYIKEKSTLVTECSQTARDLKWYKYTTKLLAFILSALLIGHFIL